MRKWEPTQIFLPGESYEQRSRVGYSPWHHKALDMTEVTTETILWSFTLFLFWAIMDNSAANIFVQVFGLYKQT